MGRRFRGRVDSGKRTRTRLCTHGRPARTLQNRGAGAQRVAVCACANPGHGAAAGEGPDREFPGGRGRRCRGDAGRSPSSCSASPAAPGFHSHRSVFSVNGVVMLRSQVKHYLVGDFAGGARAVTQRQHGSLMDGQTPARSPSERRRPGP